MVQTQPHNAMSVEQQTKKRKRAGSKNGTTRERPRKTSPARATAQRHLEAAASAATTGGNGGNRVGEPAPAGDRHGGTETDDRDVPMENSGLVYEVVVGPEEWADLLPVGLTKEREDSSGDADAVVDDVTSGVNLEGVTEFDLIPEEEARLLNDDVCVYVCVHACRNRKTICMQKWEEDMRVEGRVDHRLDHSHRLDYEYIIYIYGIRLGSG